MRTSRSNWVPTPASPRPRRGLLIAAIVVAGLSLGAAAAWQVSAHVAIAPFHTGTARSSDPTDGWTRYAGPSGAYAIRIPPSWHLFGPCAIGQTQPGQGNEVRLAPHDDMCGVDAANDDIVIDVMPAAAAPPPPASAQPACATTEPVTAGGLAGTRVEHSSNACGDYPAVWYQFTDGSRVITFAFDRTSACDFVISPAPPATDCGGTRGDFSSTLDAIVQRTASFAR